MPLDEYRKKRDFGRTTEPAGREEDRPDPAGPSDEDEASGFVVQKHAATRLHYDFRLEHRGVLLSWAVPKGPSVVPQQRRLAVRVEDHPLEYRDFEGVIPEGEYGGGTVLLWDRGRWHPRDDPDEGLRRGKLSFTLEGEKLRGRWSLVRMHDSDAADGEEWLLLKADDEAARPSSAPDLLEERPESVATGRSLDEIARDRDRIWSSSRPPPPDPGALPNSRPASLPEQPRPQLAARVEAPPDGDDWLHEIKFDGYRILAVVRGGEATLLTRNGNDWTGRFPSVARTLAALPVDEAVVDGEVVVLLPDGTTSFQDLQRALEGEADGRGRITFYAVDLLHLDGHELVEVPLLDRKDALRTLLRAAGLPAGGDVGGVSHPDAPVRYSDHVRGRGPSFLRQACRYALEGVVSKRASAPYRPGRSREWRKSKCMERQEFVVCGYTEPSGARSGFGSLLLGYHESGGALHYAGRVGTGFTQRMLEKMTRVLRELERPDPPFANGSSPADAGRDVHWVEPRVVVEVEFAEWTRDGVLRHPSFKGVREDLEPAEVGRERIIADEGKGGERAREPVSTSSAGRGGTGVPGRTRARRTGSGRGAPTRIEGVRLTHPDRVLFPDRGVTKRRLAEYYQSIDDRILEHVAGRPLTLLRCPRGRDGDCFYQKHLNESVPDAVGTVEIEESDGSGTYLTVDSTAGLVALVQMGTLEIHPWGSRIDRLERPDRVVFDLDPGPGVSWVRVVEAARELRVRLDELGLESFVKTTGGKGLHVTVPLVRRHGWPEAKAFARAVAGAMAADAPDRYVAKASKAARRGRIYVDYLRNSRGATAVAAYSARARPGAPVAVPLRWDELAPGTDPARYTVDTVLRRIRALDHDPWRGISTLRQSITRSARRALALE